VRYEPSEACHACRPPKRYPGRHAVCPAGIELARLNEERYAETLTAVRAIPDHEHTRKAKDNNAKAISKGFRRRDR
jgi:hypothetical protein